MVEGRCHSYQGYHIPGCWGCAIYDHSRCTCPRPTRPERPDPIEERLDAIERKVDRLAAALGNER